MKKVLAICLMMVLVVSMSVTAFAAPDVFTSSPSNNRAPEVLDCENGDGDCKASLVITPYGDRDTLSEQVCEQFEKAYEEIVEAEDLSVLNGGLKSLADKKNIKVQNLGISDLFTVAPKNCDDHKDHGHFDVVLKADTLQNFFGLLRYVDGKWELIEGAEVKEVNGELHLVFAADVAVASQFAIVVDATAEQGVSPETGDNTAAYLIVLAVSALAIAVISAKAKKQTA